MDNVKAIIFGRRTADEIIAALRALPAVADDGCVVVPTLDKDWTRIMFRLSGGPSVRRELWVADGDVVAEDDAPVHSGPRMLATMDVREDCADVLRSLVASFGGFICPSARAGEWQPVEAVVDPLDPEGELRLRLAKLLGPKDAHVLSAIVADETKLGALRDVLDEMVGLRERRTQRPR